MKSRKSGYDGWTGGMLADALGSWERAEQLASPPVFRTYYCYSDFPDMMTQMQSDDQQKKNKKKQEKGNCLKELK